MNEELVLISEKGNMRRFRRQISRFDPNAIDADGDGVVQEGTPFKRPAKPRAMRGLNVSPRNNEPTTMRRSFWDYAKPKPIEIPEELVEDDKPDHRNWRDIPLKPRSGEMVSDTVTHEISTDKVKRDEWYAFQDAVLERLLDVRDDESIPKDERRGLMKLYSSLKNAKPKKSDDGKLVLSLTDTERARILKGIQSMRRKKFDIPNMDAIFDMLESVEKKSAFAISSSEPARPFVGVRHKHESLMHVVISPAAHLDPRLEISKRETGFRTKGDSPRLRIDSKALGRSISGRIRRSGRVITSRFDPNAVDADGDGLVQDATPFERPSAPPATRLLQGAKPTRGISEARRKPKKPNSVMKAQADRKAMNFQIEKLRSTLRRVGDDYAPSWWDTTDNKKFAENIKQASPEELAELFARIYVERRALMTAKVGRLADGSIKVYADAPDKKSNDRNAMLQKRGEMVYREMFGRLVDPTSPTANIKKRESQFSNWYNLAADNADWYFEQSFKITKRKSRKKLGVNAPVNRRGTRWAQDPDFPEESFDKLVDSIETDLRRANPSISREAANNRARQIIRESDKRMGRKPNKSPRVGGDRQVIDNKPYVKPSRRLARRAAEVSPVFERENKVTFTTYVAKAPSIRPLDYTKAQAEMQRIIAANQQKYGQLQTYDDFYKTFKSIAPQGIYIDFLSSARKSKRLNRTPSEHEKSLMHAYLHTFEKHPQILNHPIEIQALKAQAVDEGTNGSHGLKVNLTDDSKPFFKHSFHYASEKDLTTRYTNFHNEMMNLSQQGSGVSVSFTETAQGRVMRDFWTKNYRSNMSQSEIDALVDEIQNLGTFSTTLHEGGHAAQSTAEMMDKWGVNAVPSQVLGQIDTGLDGLSDSDYLKVARGSIEHLLNKEMKQIFEDNAGAMQFVAGLNQHIDVGQIYDLYQRTGSMRNAVAMMNLNPVSQQLLLNELQRVAPEILGVYTHYTRWRQSRNKYDMPAIEKFIRSVQSDTGLSQVLNNHSVFKIPMTSNGNVDAKALRDKSPTANGGLMFHQAMINVSVIRQAHKEFAFDSLSSADQAIARDAMEKISEYARRTSVYGPAFGKDSNVESIAEMTAVALTGSLDLITTDSEEVRVMNLLLNWLQDNRK